jgi:hypothetical protein
MGYLAGFGTQRKYLNVILALELEQQLYNLQGVAPVDSDFSDSAQSKN